MLSFRSAKINNRVKNKTNSTSKVGGVRRPNLEQIGVSYDQGVARAIIEGKETSSILHLFENLKN